MAPASGSAPGGRAMAEERSPIQHVLIMRRTEVETNVHHFYALMIEHDLFGRVVLVRRWGRIGTRAGAVGPARGRDRGGRGAGEARGRQAPARIPGPLS